MMPKALEINHDICSKMSFPFETKLSFEPLIKTWNEGLLHQSKIIRELSQNVIDQYKSTDILQDENLTIENVNTQEEFLDTLMSILFSPAYWDSQIVGAFKPFSMDEFYSSPMFKKLNPLSLETLSLQKDFDPAHMIAMKTINAYMVIAERYYDFNIDPVDHKFIFLIPDDNKLERYYNVQVNTKYCEVLVNSELPKLTKQQISELKSNVFDLKKWMTYIPPEAFTFYGFTVFQATDVTDQELISGLKYNLIDNQSLINADKFSLIEAKLQSLLNSKDINIGLTALTSNSDSSLREQAHHIGKSFLFGQDWNCSCADLKDSIYERAFKKRVPVLISEIQDTCSTAVQKQLYELGLRNILVAPLVQDDEVIGLLEIASKNANDINFVNQLKLEEVFSLFSIAVKRVLEEKEAKIQTIIKEKCTAIHPSVEWRFKDVAGKYLKESLTNDNPIIDPIVFENVYPLFGLSDIRNSSIIRNKMIYDDLIVQLDNAKAVLDHAVNINPLPYLKELHFRLDKKYDLLESGLNSGDEMDILDFLQTDIETVFTHIKDFSEETDELISIYHSELDPQLGIVYKQRKRFENSVAHINNSISSILEDEEEDAQEMFPHYFEKYKTDGVDHGIYIGQSLTSEKPFDRLYLKNMRLWQLLTMCKIVKRSHTIKPELEIELETAHLLLVQDHPLSIRFRYEEKHFDVDGAYNIRYEIIKKRIDKALIKHSNERLTQPNKIAIVYSQPKEAEEYLSYIDYLQSINLLEKDIEDVELEKLQGVNGLKALRVTVNLEETELQEKFLKDVLEYVK